MSFIGLIAKNLVRQPVRALLTLVGITLGIATVVALGVIAAGLRDTAGAFVRSGGADFLVAQEGAADMTLSVVAEERLDDVARVEGVAEVYGVFLHLTTAGSNPFFFLVGMEDDAIATHPPVLVEGRLRQVGDGADAIMLGEAAADDLGASVGSTVEISDRPFTVVGIFRSDVVWENGGAFASLGAVQDLAGRQDVVTVAFVHVDGTADRQVVADRVEQTVAGVTSISNADEYGKVDQGFVLIDGANVAISVLAVVIGGIGVMNTMVMSIFERTREIGVLRAIGWSGRRVLTMVLLESVLLCLAAVVAGSVLGVALSRLAGGLPAVQGLLVLSYPPAVFLQATMVGVVVGLLGALYPAIRASRLLPVEALRYE